MNNSVAERTKVKKLRINRRTRTIITIIIIFLFILGVYLTGTFMSNDLIQADFSQKGLKPSFKHPFGTDLLGRDM